MGKLRRVAAIVLGTAAAAAALAQSDDKALREAAETGHAQRAWSLLRAGNTAADVARTRGYDEIVKLLEKR